MIAPVVIGMLGGALTARLFARRAFRHRLGGCERQSRFGHLARRAAVVTRPAIALDRVVAALDLSSRQREALDDLWQLVRDKLGVEPERWPQLRQALASVAAESFDVASLGALPKELVDGFEHLHDILLPEQRLALLKSLS